MSFCKREPKLANQHPPGKGGSGRGKGQRNGSTKPGLFHLSLDRESVRGCQAGKLLWQPLARVLLSRSKNAYPSCVSRSRARLIYSGSVGVRASPKKNGKVQRKKAKKKHEKHNNDSKVKSKTTLDVEKSMHTQDRSGRMRTEKKGVRL